MPSIARFLATLSVGAFGALLPATQAVAAPTLTDLLVFSTDATGNNWESLVWNTEGLPVDVPNRWNLYVSSSPNPSAPSFINHENDDSVRIAIGLVPGDYTFLLFAEGVDRTLPAGLHFVLNLYFDGNTVPSISAITGPTCPTGTCPAAHPNGMTILGASGAPEAGTLVATVDGLRVTLTGFTWDTNPGLNVVWPHWANDPPYQNNPGDPDYLGTFSFSVRSVPAPGALSLLGAGLVAAAVAARRRRPA